MSQYLFKRGAKGLLPKTLFGYFSNFNLLLGLGFYLLYLLCLTFAYRFFESSALFSMVSFCFVWALIIARTFLKENISMVKILGVLFIIFGSITINFK